jgi:hypothetical protein
MTEPFWKTARHFIRWRFSRASRQVLIARRLEMADGLHERWFRRDIESFLEALEETAQDMRTLARPWEMPTTGNRLMIELAVYTAAAYRTLLDVGLSQIAARGAIADIGWLVYAWMLQLSSLPFRFLTRDPGKRLRGTIRLLLRFPFNAPGAPGYEVEAHCEGEDMITNWTRCPPQSFVRDLVAETGDQGDLEAFYESWCLYDWPGADIIAGDGIRGHYARRRTLSRGDPVCDMCWKARATGSMAEADVRAR